MRVNKDKQIEEMAKTILDVDRSYYGMECDEIQAKVEAIAIYNAGYRKASEVAREIQQDIIEPLWEAWQNDASELTVLLVAMILETITYKLKRKYAESEGTE